MKRKPAPPEVLDEKFDALMKIIIDADLKISQFDEIATFWVKNKEQIIKRTLETTK